MREIAELQAIGLDQLGEGQFPGTAAMQGDPFALEIGDIVGLETVADDQIAILAATVGCDQSKIDTARRGDDRRKIPVARKVDPLAGKAFIDQRAADRGRNREPGEPDPALLQFGFQPALILDDRGLPLITLSALERKGDAGDGDGARLAGADLAAAAELEGDKRADAEDRERVMMTRLLMNKMPCRSRTPGRALSGCPLLVPVAAGFWSCRFQRSVLQPVERARIDPLADIRRRRREAAIEQEGAEVGERVDRRRL